MPPAKAGIGPPACRGPFAPRGARCALHSLPPIPADPRVHQGFLMWFSKLLPRDGNFFELFNQHADRTAEGSRAFMAMIQNYNDIPLREKYAAEVDTAERAADKVTAEVHRLLHRTFITPIDREQIH